jgi:phenylalanyl-tRNA synthetase beta chain
VIYDPKAGKNFLHPGRQANVVYDGQVIGYLGEVHPVVAANYNIKEQVYVAVLDMPQIVEKACFDKKYQGIARFPAATRDISMVVPKQILVGQIEQVFEEKGGAYLESYELFDIYEGNQITLGFKSIAYSLTFRAKDRNLEEEDITGAMNRILKALDALGIQLRK